MSINMEAAIAKAYALKNAGITYSMLGSRIGTDGTADCSGMVYAALRAGGGSNYGCVPCTETLHDYLLKNGFELIAENREWNMQRGDVVIWGKKGSSAGAGGHTGICVDNHNWIECTGWKNGIIVYDHDVRWVMVSGPYFYVYRQKGGTEQPTMPKAVQKTQTPSNHDKAVANSKPVHQGNAWGKLDFFNVVCKGKVRIAGWLVPDTPEGVIGKFAEVLIMEHGTTNEITRVASQGIKRPDVKKAYGYKGGDALGLDVTLDLSWVKKETKIDVLFRRCNQANGEGTVNDVRIKDIYLTL
ncbi:peptidoglycan amidohydrolase family protein [Enterococcus hirae]|uniref:peptidoglycan amidohydrolase family protein n=1 Tax=Enterococcus hirae TaxID=1354 RepID=UPI0020739D08|nr:peptidoglycan amidohydrolase family protein [Enterococcus hirae]